MDDAVKWYNIFEGFLWSVFAAVFFVAALKPGEKNRRFCLMGGLIFVVMSLSEFYEVRTGAWWRPWWLILWKGGVGVAFVPMYLWYRKIKRKQKQTLVLKEDTTEIE